MLVVTHDTCLAWFTWGDNNARAKNYAKSAYDTLMRFIDSCNSEPYAVNAIGDMGSAVEYMGGKPADWLSFRAWLKTVLYLNTSDKYYCGVVGTIAYTYWHFPNPDYNADVALLDFLDNCVRCVHDSAQRASDWATRQDFRREQLLEYRDTVHDSIATPLDTTLPSLESLGLGILTNSVEPGVSVSFGREIVSLRALENPFSKQTSIAFELNDQDAVQLEVFDVLGHRVFSDKSHVFESGSHTIPIDIGESPSGMYYLRLSTLSGDLRTLKLISK